MNGLDNDLIKSQIEKRQKEMQPLWDEIAESNEEFRNAVLSVPEQINVLNQKIEREQEERKAADRKAQWKTNVTILIAFLSLVVTLIGIIGQFQTKMMQETPEILPTEVSDQSE